MKAVPKLIATMAVMLLSSCANDEPARPTPSDEPSTTPISATDAGARTLTGVQLIDVGIEPRVRLSITSLGPTELRVSATSKTEGTVGGEPFDDEVTARYRLLVELSEDASRDQLIARMTPTNLETAGFANTVEPRFWEWRLGSDGVLSIANPPAVPRGSALVSLLSLQALILMVPDEPVGSGARWTYAERDTDTPVEVRLDSIGADDLTATISARSETGEARIEIIASGQWDRTSLVASQATSTLELALSAPTTRNGDEIQIAMSKRVALTYEADR